MKESLEVEEGLDRGGEGGSGPLVWAAAGKGKKHSQQQDSSLSVEKETKEEKNVLG